MRSLTPAKLTLLMLIVVGGLISAYIGKKFLFQKPKQAYTGTRNAPLTLAELSPGTVIRKVHLGKGPVRVEKLTRETLLNDEKLIGRIVKKTIPAASTIQAHQLYQPGDRPKLKLEPGMRAVAISVGEKVSMVNGHIRPTQYVDVHLTVTGGNRVHHLEGGMTLTLFEGVKVLSINSHAYSSGIRTLANAVTLELTPEQANIMILARNRGDITLSYNPDGKGDGGVAVSDADRVTLKEILGIHPVEHVEEAPTFWSKPPYVSEIYRGNHRSLNHFQNGKRVESSRNPQPSKTQNQTNSQTPTLITPKVQPAI